MAEDRFVTFATAGIMLGGAEQPLGRDFLKRLIRDGHLIDNGLAHKARRISRKSVLALLTRMEEGTFLDYSPEYKTRPRAKAPPKARGTAKSRSATGSRNLDEELRRMMRLTTGKPR
jgi:hypothetical protein